MMKSIKTCLLISCCLMSMIHASWAEKTLATLTLEQKIGQLFVVAAVSDEDSGKNDLFMGRSPYRMDKRYIERLIQQYHVGGLIFLGYGNTAQQYAITRHYQQMSRVPLLISQDFEWGLSMRLTDAVKFPRNMTLGAIADDGLLYDFGKEVGRQMRHLGVHLNCAPVVDVNNNADNPIIHDRSFGEHSSDVARKGIMVMRGLSDACVLACAKHFPGHGDTAVDSHRALPCIMHDKARLHAVELYPFKKLIDEGVPALMMAHLLVPAFDGQFPASVSYTITTDLLRNELGFNGLIITDGLGMRALTNAYEPGEIELQACLAGNDILLCSLDVPRATALIKQALDDGRLSHADLDATVMRILRAKEWAQVRQVPAYDADALHTPSAYRLKKQLYHEAITLVRDRAGIVPLQDPACVACIVVGAPHDCMFARMLADAGCALHVISSQLSADDLVQLKEFVDAHDTLIVGVCGMNKNRAAQYGVSESLRTWMYEYAQTGKKIIVTIFGTPYSLPLFASIPTVLLAYEDDADAQEGAALVLLGKRQATGRLPVLRELQEG